MGTIFGRRSGRRLRALRQRAHGAGRMPERLEERRLLAFDFVAAFTEPGTPFFVANVSPAEVGLTASPQQITLRFSPGTVIDHDQQSLARGISVVRSGRGGDAFGDTGAFADEPVTLGSLTVNDAPNQNEVIVRFAETLPDDTYRITIQGDTNTTDAIRDGLVTAPRPPLVIESFRDGGSFSFDIRLNLGAHVVSVVPQPVIRAKTIDFKAVPADGDLLEVAIRGGRRIFEFDSGNGVQAGNTPISLTNATVASLASAVATAINALSTAPGFTGELLGTSASAVGAVVTFTGTSFTPVVSATRGGSALAASVITVGDGALTHLRDRVVVHFNVNDPLNVASAQNPANYQLFETNSANGDALAVVTPTSVSYDAVSATAVLSFAPNAVADDKLYRLQVGNSADANNTLATATNVGTVFERPDLGPAYTTTARIGDGISGANDVDLYKFRLTAGGTITVTATPQPGLDVALRLFDANGTPITTGVNVTGMGAGAVKTLTYVAASAGTFLVGVSSTGNAAYSASNGAGAAGGTTTGSYTLAIASTVVVPGIDENSSYATATGLGTLGVGGVFLAAAIQNRPTVPTPAGGLPFPNPWGALDYVGQRDIPVDGGLERHGMPGVGGAADATSIVTRYYNFRSDYGPDPQGNTLFNAITETQKQRAREIFDLFSLYTGIRFVESENLGIQIITGDLRGLDPPNSWTTPDTPGGLATLGGNRSIMNSGIDWGDSEYGGAWFQVAMHEIGHNLGLLHSYDLPSIMGAGEAPSDGLLPTEAVFPGNYDIEHTLQLLPRSGTDIDVYSFQLDVDGHFTAETIVARPGQPLYIDPVTGDPSYLDTVITVYRETAGGIREMIARNDDYFGRDSFVGLDLPSADAFGGRYTYYVAVTSTGNTDFNPEIENSGLGGRTEGAYQLSLGFTPVPVTAATIVDTAGTPLDGNRDGVAGGAFDFWFNTAAASATAYVDKAAVNTGGVAGSITNPYTTISAAITAVNAANNDANLANDKRIIRIVGNDGNAATLADEKAYLVGRAQGQTGTILSDGATFNVPRGVTVMIDEGAVLKLRGAVIDVGSSSAIPTASRTGAALQVLGTPGREVRFTSYHDDTVGGDSDGVGPAATGGQWGGVVLRQDSDVTSKRAFVNTVTNAQFRFGGGQVVVDSQLRTFTPIQLESTRPTIAFNRITNSAGAAMSADPNSFDDSAGRIGPELRGNLFVETRNDGPGNAPVTHTNSINGIFVSIATAAGSVVNRLTVPARFKSNDIVYVIAENLIIDGGAGGYLLTGGQEISRATGRLTIDPGVVVKLVGSRIELERGYSRLYAEGLPGSRVIFTSLADGRYGAGGTFDTNGNQPDIPAAGDWAGIVLNAGATGSIDHAYVGFGGGTSPIEGRIAHFNVFEAHQADLRLARSRVENNAGGFSAADGIRTGRGTNAAAAIFVRGAQPIIVGNDFRDNLGSLISINANSLDDRLQGDSGRSTGGIRRFAGYDDNFGPLVRDNRISYTINAAAGRPAGGAISGMEVRGEEITVEGVWDDTDIVHVLRSEIVVNNFHTATGLRLLSQSNASLVVKAFGPTTAGLTARGVLLDIDDRIGGTVQVIGQPGYPVIMTSLHDDTVYASLDPLGLPTRDTNNDGTASAPTPGDWRGLRFLEMSNDRNVAVVREGELAYTSEIDVNGIVDAAQVLGTLAPNYATPNPFPLQTRNSWESAQEKSGDENRRLGFEVHGTIAFDDPTDVDVYSFTGYAGSEVWIDIDKTTSGLDAMVELLDADGNVLARSADSLNDIGVVHRENPERVFERVGGTATVAGEREAVTGVAAAATSVVARVVGTQTTVTGVAAGVDRVAAQVSGSETTVTGVAAGVNRVAGQVMGSETTVTGTAAAVVGRAINVVAAAGVVTQIGGQSVTIENGGFIQDQSGGGPGALVYVNNTPTNVRVVQNNGGELTLSGPLTGVALGNTLGFSIEEGQSVTTSRILVSAADFPNAPAASQVNGFTGGPATANVTDRGTATNSWVRFNVDVTVARDQTLRFGPVGNVLEIDEIDAVAVGAAVSAPSIVGFPAGITVSSRNTATSQIQLSGNVNLPHGTILTFNIASGSRTASRVVVASPTGAAAGVPVTGTGITAADGVTVVGAPSGNVVTLSAPRTVTNNQALAFGFNSQTIQFDLGNVAVPTGAQVFRNNTLIGTVDSSTATSVTLVNAAAVANNEFLALGFGTAPSITTRVIQVDDIDAVRQNATVTGTGVPGGVTVASRDVATRTVVLSGDISSTPGMVLQFGFAGGGALTASRVVVASPTGAAAGVPVTGTGITAADGVTVVGAPSGDVVTLSAPRTVTNNQALAFGFNSQTIQFDLGNVAVPNGAQVFRNNTLIGTVDSSTATSVTLVNAAAVANNEFLAFGFGTAPSITTRVVQVDDIDAVRQGATVNGTGVPGGVTVASRDVATRTVVLSGDIPATPGMVLQFGFAGGGALTASRVVVANPTGAANGVPVTGTGITAADGVTVVGAPSGNVVTLSAPRSVSNNQSLVFGFSGPAVTIDTAGFATQLAGVAITRNGAVVPGVTVDAIVGSTVTVSGGNLHVANGDFLGFANATAVAANRFRIDPSVAPSVGAEVSVNGVASGFTVDSFDATSRTVTLNGSNTVFIDTDDLVGFTFVGAGAVSTTRVRVADMTGISANVLVTGVAGVPAGTRVQTVTPDASGTGGTVEFTQAVTVANGNTLGFGFNGTTVTVTNGAIVPLGSAVAGQGIPSGPPVTTVTSVTGDSVLFSQNVDVADGGTLFLGTRTFQLAPAATPPGTLEGVLPGTLAGVVYRDNTAIQTFTVDRAGVFTFTPIGNPTSRVVGGPGAPGSVATLDRDTGLITLPFDVPPTGTIRLEVSYEFSRLPLATLGFTPGGEHGAYSLVKDAWRGNDHYSSSPRDPGMRVILPGTVGDLNQYFLRVRSQRAHDATTTLPQYAADLADPALVTTAGATSGRYELRVRLRQRDEKPGSTVRYADIRYPVTGIEVIGLPRSSPLVGETGEISSGANTSFATAQQLGNLLTTDRNTISVAGEIANAGDIDWYTFTLDYDLIQSIGGISGGTKTWATIFDIDYADGFRGDLTLSVFDAAGRLIYMGRDSDIADDQPAPGQGNDFDDLSRGSLGKLDPYIGTAQLPAGGPGSTTRYYVAVSSNERLPQALNAYFNSSALNPQIRLEPINSVRRVVQDRIGNTGYLAWHPDFLGSETNAVTQPSSGAIIDIANATTLAAHVRPFTLADVTLFVSTSNHIYTVDAYRGGTGVGNYWETRITGDSPYLEGAIADLDMRTDGSLMMYQRRNVDAANNGQVFFVNATNGTRTLFGGDGIADDVSPATEDNLWRVTGPSADAFAIRRSDVATYNSTSGTNGSGAAIVYSIQDSGFSYIYSAQNDGTAAMSLAAPPAHTYGRMGYVDTVGTGITGVTTGLQFRNETGDLYGVSSGGQFFRIARRNATAGVANTPLVVDQIADFSSVLQVGESFQGLATGPVNLEGGRYQGTFFAITNRGRLVVINPDGAGTGQPALMANVFDTTGDGYANSHISNFTVSAGETGVTGLAFSPLDVNLWHPTNRRGDSPGGDSVPTPDPGHGVNTARDNTRVDQPGVISMYFGLENWANRDGGFLVRGGPGQYGTVGGLPYNWQEDLTANPTIGNNYNVPGGAYGSLITNPFSLAGYAYTDKPTLYFNYFLESQNASGRTDSNFSMRDSARAFISTDDGLTWTLLATNNQARSDNDGDAPEAELPHTLSASSAIGLAPNQHVQELFDTAEWRQARVDLGKWAGESSIRLRFDFSTAGMMDATDRSRTVPDAVRSVTATPVAPNLSVVAVDSTEGLQEGMAVRWGQANETLVRRATSAAVTNQTIVPLANVTGLVAGMTVSGVGAPIATIDSINAVNSTVALSRAVTVANGTTLLFGRVDAQTTIQAIDSLNNEITLSNPVGVTLSSQLHFFREISPLLNNIENVTAPANTLGSFRGNSLLSRERGANNDFEGFYIDDIIVGFAERGEMVTGAVADQTAFFSLNTPSVNEYTAQVLTGPYQLEIRRGTEYARQPDPGAAQTGIFQLFDTNDRFVTSPAETVLVLEENPLDAVSSAVTARGTIDSFSSGLRMSGSLGAATQHNAVFWTVDLAEQPDAFLEFEYLTGTSEAVTSLPATFTLGGLATGTAGNQLPSGDGVAISTDGGLEWTLVSGFSSTRGQFRTMRVNLNPDRDPDALTATTVIGFFQSGSLTASAGGGITVRNALITTAPRVATTGLVGDRNLLREQGQFIIESNIVSNASQYGIRVDAASRDPVTGAPRPGVAMNLPTLNNQRLVPGTVITNNILASNATAGVLFSGQTNAPNQPPAVAPFGRIVNNTFYGGGAGVGVQVTDNASPTLLNNLFAALATGVSVDGGSAAAGTIIGYSAYYATATPVAGTTQTDQLVLTEDPFINAAGRNFYLAPGSAAIDSSLDLLQDRNQFVVLKDAVGIPPSPLLAPSLDLYGQLRLDDPDVAGGAPGLGLNVFKDRGAVERADFVQPTATIVTPLDNSTADGNPLPNVVRLERSDARGVLQFMLQLNDIGVGIDDATVSTGVFVVDYRPLAGGTDAFEPLVDGTDYVFVYLENTKTVVFQSPSVFRLGEYRIEVDNSLETGIRDLAGNRLLNNNVNGVGTTAFTIALVDVPGTPTGVQGTVLDGAVALQWTAPTAPSGATLTGFFVEHSVDGGTTWSRSAQLAASATSHTVTGLTNATPYLFRVAAVNDSGIVPTPPETVTGLGAFSTPISVTPLATPTLALASDTGASNTDLVTSDGTVNVGSLHPGGTFEFSTDSGATWSAQQPNAQPTFALSEGTYGAGTIRVRQTLPVGNTSLEGANAQAIVVDQTAPPVPTLALAPGVTDPVSATEGLQPVTVLGDVGATINVTFQRVGGGTVGRTITGTGVAQAVTLNQADLVTLGDGLITVTATQTDLAGNVQLSGSSLQFTLDTIPPFGAATLAIGPGITVPVSAAEATQAAGVVVVSGDAGNLVVVQFTRGPITVSKTVTADGTPAQAVVLTAADLATLGNGLVTVTATQTDPAGNPQTQPIQMRSFTLDATAPNPVVLALGPGITDPVSRAEALQAAGVVTALGEVDATITVTLTGASGAVIKILSGTGSSQAVELSAADLVSLGDGPVTVTASQTDVAGNMQSAGTTPVAFILDATAPVPSVLVLGAGVANGATLAEATQPGGVVTVTGEVGATILVTFTREATTITKTLVGTGSAEPVVLSTAEVNQLGDGGITVSAMQVDAAGNPQSASASELAFTIDTIATSITIASTTQALRAGQTALITFTLSEPSTTFGSDDVSVTGGTLSDFSGSGAVYTATFAPAADSIVSGTVAVAAGTFTDAAGNGNTASALTPSLAIDTVLPTVVITSSTQSLRVGQIAILTFTISEPTTDFTAADVAVTGGTLSNFAGSGTLYTATFTPFADSTVPGTVTVATGGFTDAAGNPNMAGSLALPIDIDTVPPRPTVPPSSNLSTNPQVVPNLRAVVRSIPLSFSKPVTGVTVNAFRLYLNGRSVSLRGVRVTGSGTEYRLVFPLRRTTPRGIYTLEVRSDAGIRSVADGASLAGPEFFYWGRGRSVGITRTARFAAFASLR